MRTDERVELSIAGESREVNKKHSFGKITKFGFLVLRYTFLFALLILLASHEAANPKVGNTNIEFYSAEFSARILQLDLSVDSAERKLAKQFYMSRQELPAWTTNYELNTSFEELDELISSAYFYGLLPGNYYHAEITYYKMLMQSAASDEKKMEARLCLEQAATAAALKFMTHISSGINASDTSAYYLNLRNSLPSILSFHLENENLREGILSLQPENKQYHRLQNALAKYLYTAISDTAVYTTEQLKNTADMLSLRLAKQGYLDQSFVGDSAAISTAVRNFQEAHHLEVTGELDAKTLEELSKGTKNKFYRIALNLDRIRKDRIQNNNQILVNIPEYQLYYYNKQGTEVNFNVMVGKKSSPTPLISSQIELIVANPYWTVPRRIARYEMLPRIKKDSLFLKRNGFSVVDNRNQPVDMDAIDWQKIEADEFNYWLRQTNKNNALGVIKFLFPNEYSVYLHDTQSKSLFKRKIRAFSHGCVRVQNPDKLAQLIVENDNSENKDMDVSKIIKSRDRKEIKMSEALPIHIRYYTCTADSLGKITFHNDIYSMDETAIQELFGNSKWN